jgi:hypothetical protein
LVCGELLEVLPGDPQRLLVLGADRLRELVHGVEEVLRLPLGPRAVALADGALNLGERVLKSVGVVWVDGSVGVT